MEKWKKINILFEDNHLLVVEKPINMPVCEDDSGDNDLLNELKRYLKEKYNKPGEAYLGLVHRLDRPVGGVMVFAKTSKAAARLSSQITKDEFEKVYLAVVCGKVAQNGTFEDYLIKDKKQNISRVCGKEIGKYAKLEYELVNYIDNFSLVKVYLHTGRSHQIRVQFASRSFPLVGDSKYNPKNDNKVNVALFAYKLAFYHPITKEKISFELEIPKRYPFNLF